MHAEDRHTATPAPPPVPRPLNGSTPGSDGPAAGGDRPPAAPGDPAGGAGDPTGDAGVDRALAQLTGLTDAPLREHVAVFEAVHAALQARLADDGD